MAATAASNAMSRFGGPGEVTATVGPVIGSAATWADSGLSFPLASTAATMK